MTWTLEVYQDMIKMYHHTKNEVSVLTASKVIAQKGRYTQRHGHKHTHRHYENIISTT